MLREDARIVWKSLKGIICVYKPAEITCNQVRRTITANICKELCELKNRPISQYVNIEGNANNLTVTVQDNFADHPLVVGPRYQPEGLRCTWATFLSKNTSGVLLLGFNEGAKKTQLIHSTKPTRAYRVSGKFGEATDTFFKDGKVVERSTFRHIRQNNIDRLLSAMQTAHQKKMFELCGVDMQSQAAYDLASQGLIRPSDSKIPVIYGIKCVHYDAPNFTIEIQSINEYEKYFMSLIHEIGMQLRSTAHCTSVQCIRHSYFSLDYALLRKHWTLQNIVDNMHLCQKLLDEHKNITVKQTAALQ